MNYKELVDKAARIVDEEAMTLSREEFIRENGTYPAWSSEHQGARRIRARHVARAILDAAEAWIRADTLRRAADDFEADEPDSSADAPEWLRAWADRLEAGE